MRVLIADDHAMVAQGLSLLLSSFEGINVVGIAQSGEEALALTRDLAPALVFLDLYLGDATGLNMTRRLLHINPSLKIIIITAETSNLLPFRLLEAGALGYVHKGADQAALKEAITQVKKGGRYITPQIAQQFVLAQGGVATKGNPFELLSKREIEVMLLMVQGASAQEMAEQLHVSPKTVHTHRGRILEKLGVKNDVALTLLAISSGVITVNAAETSFDE